MNPLRLHPHRAAGPLPAAAALLALWAAPPPAAAHEPVFSPGPHTIFGHGLEVGTEFNYLKAGPDRVRGAALHLGYGLTPDLEVGAELPFLDNSYGPGGPNQSGLGDVEAYTHWRFWRDDQLGYQDAAGALLDVKFDTAGGARPPSLGTGATSELMGFDVSHEGLKWYRWASAYYEHNGTNGAGFHYGDKVYFNLVGGWRPTPPSFLKPDTVWMLELDSVYARHDTLNGADVAGTGGTEIFLAPDIMWTLRNFAIRAGVQLPLYSRLNRDESPVDYHVRLEFEWDFATL